MLNKLIRYFLENRLITGILILIIVGWGLISAPFFSDWHWLPSNPVAVDAIPDLGENQQIIFTEWAGQSPQDIDDQITYPLTTYLLGTPGVKTIRSSSMLGFSSIYLIFDEDVDFYWSRSRILEKINAIPEGLLPANVSPVLGPDATALGQVFWYTLEGRDSTGQVTAGWDLHELREIQDFYVKYALSSTKDVAEVASIGGHVQEYHVEVDPTKLKAYNISLNQIFTAVQNSNQDVGAKTMEINQVEYLIRGVGYLKQLTDLENVVVAYRKQTPILLREVAHLSVGPAYRRGILDKGGAEVVGGVVVARYGANPLEVIENLKKKIAQVNSGLPNKTLQDGTVSQLTIVPFYDRSTLIEETLATLEDALSLEVLITILVVIVMVYNLRASALISGLLPLAVLMVFIAMKYLHIDANIVSLSGIAIAIGTMVDLGIVLSENILKHLDEKSDQETLTTTISKATREIAPAIITAVATTIVSFVPVFSLTASEGKLFIPLAATKTLSLCATLIVALFVLPALASIFFNIRLKGKKTKLIAHIILLFISVLCCFYYPKFLSFWLLFFGIILLLLTIFADWRQKQKWLQYFPIGWTVIAVWWLLTSQWMPLGVLTGFGTNLIFVGSITGLILLFFVLLIHYYRPILTWCLQHKKAFLSIPASLALMGLLVWLGFSTVFRWLLPIGEKIGLDVSKSSFWNSGERTFPGLGSEFMPSLNEGSFLLMPSTMPHAGIEYNKDMLSLLDQRVAAIPEVETVVGKSGRVASALDPAPLSMYENMITYFPEYFQSKEGEIMRFKVDDSGKFLTHSGKSLTNDEIINLEMNSDDLIKDEDGQPLRHWRSHIKNTDDIWTEIANAAQIPGLTTAPKLQPIETRLVMLQTGMRAPMGIKIFGPDLKTIEDFGLSLEKVLKEVPELKSEAVFADRIVGKPYLEIVIDRQKLSLYGLSVKEVQQVISTAIGGKTATTTVEGRTRHAVTIQYPKAYRQDAEAIKYILIETKNGEAITLGHVTHIEYRQGPQNIKGENTFLIGYVLFDKATGIAEVNAVEAAQKAINKQITQGQLKIPEGVRYEFSGTYENQLRASKRLSIIIPLVLVIVFVILYMQFRSVTTSLMVYSAIAIAFSGGFVMIWLWGQDWFFNLDIGEISIRQIFQMHEINLSVAVWIGFIALFGIATDDGVLMATYLTDSLKQNTSTSISQIHDAVIEGGLRRIRPSVMTTATTVIALLPILTSTGKGADIMIPMAIPAFGGMLIDISSYFIVPVLFAVREERKLKKLTAIETSIRG